MNNRECGSLCPPLSITGVFPPRLSGLFLLDGYIASAGAAAAFYMDSQCFPWPPPPPPPPPRRSPRPPTWRRPLRFGGLRRVGFGGRGGGPLLLVCAHPPVSPPCPPQGGNPPPTPPPRGGEKTTVLPIFRYSSGLSSALPIFSLSSPYFRLSARIFFYTAQYFADSSVMQLYV